MLGNSKEGKVRNKSSISYKVNKAMKSGYKTYQNKNSASSLEAQVNIELLPIIMTLIDLFFSKSIMKIRERY